MGSVGGVLFLSLAVLAFLKFKKRDKHQQQEASVEMSPPSNDPQNSDFYAASAPANETVTHYSSTQDTDYMRYPTNESQNNTKTVSPKPKVYAANNVNVAYEDVSMDHKLGQGAFGVV